jgi:hypothetical protein
MLAMRYAVEHDDCPVTVNIDRLGRGRNHHYNGKSPEEVRDDSSHAGGAALPHTAPGGGGSAWRNSEMACFGEYADTHGVSREPIASIGERALPDGDVKWARKPSQAYAISMVDAISAWSTFVLYGRAQSPIVVVLPERTPKAPRGVGESYHPQRAGLADALASLAPSKVRTASTRAGHLMPIEVPREVGDLVVGLYPGQ